MQGPIAYYSASFHNENISHDLLHRLVHFLFFLFHMLKHMLGMHCMTDTKIKNSLLLIRKKSKQIETAIVLKYHIQQISKNPTKPKDSKNNKFTLVTIECIVDCF